MLFLLSRRAFADAEAFDAIVRHRST